MLNNYHTFILHNRLLHALYFSLHIFERV